jgi:hypothetical protein
MSELAEGARLEIVCVVYSGTEGSNPSLSAIFLSLLGLVFTSEEKFHDRQLQANA